MVKPVPRLGARSMHVFLVLREQLASGQFSPGARLPTEKELCRQFAASHSTIRRAVGKLAAEGWLTVRQGSGTYVCEPPVPPERSQTISIMYGRFDEEFTLLHDAMMRAGYLACVFPQVRSCWDLDLEKAFLERIRTERHTGLLAFCSPHSPTNAETLEKVQESGVRVVHIEHFRMSLPEQDYALPDYTRAGVEAATQMHLAGYDEILYVTDNAAAPFSRMIQRGVETALGQFGRPFDEAEHVYEPLKPVRRRDDAQQALRDRIRRASGSIGVISDAASIGTLVRRLVEGVEWPVPDRVGLVGVETLGERPDAISVDTLRFDRSRLLQSALRQILTPAPEPLHMLTLPERCLRGTVRAAVPHED